MPYRTTPHPPSTLLLPQDDPRYDSSDEREKIDGDFDDAPPSEDEGEGEDLIENMEADYQQIAELDQYDSQMLDDRKYQGMTFDERKLAEEENARRAARAQGLEDLLADDGEEDDERKADRRGRFQRGQESEFADEDVEVDDESDIENDDELDLKALDQVQVRSEKRRFHLLRCFILTRRCAPPRPAPRLS